MPQFFDMSRKPPAGEVSDVGVSDARRARNVQRLQIGITGIVMMILLVGLANIIQDRAMESDATTVPDAAPTTEPTQAATQNDPLVEAGVVPDLPAEPNTPPVATPTAAPPLETDAEAAAD